MTTKLCFNFLDAHIKSVCSDHFSLSSYHGKWQSQCEMPPFTNQMYQIIYSYFPLFLFMPILWYPFLLTDKKARQSGARRACMYVVVWAHENEVILLHAGYEVVNI